MKWRFRARRPVSVSVSLTPDQFRVNHSMTVTHEHKPRPMPTRVWAVIVNTRGERWMVSPAPVYGRNVVLPAFPLGWLTGRPQDSAAGQVSVELQFEYDGIDR